MPIFIKRKFVTVDGSRTIAKDWTNAELTKMRVTTPSRFLTVTESHAADVVRPQDKYQEVQDG